MVSTLSEATQLQDMAKETDLWRRLITFLIIIFLPSKKAVDAERSKFMLWFLLAGKW